VKVICNRDDLLQAVRTVQNALTSTALPVLSHVLILAKEKGGEVIATNLESTIYSNFEADVEEEGNICLPGVKLFSILRELPPGQLSLETRDSEGLIKMEQIFFSLLGLPGEDFPETPAPLKPVFTLPQQVLRMIFEKTMFSAGQDEVRQNLNCVFLETTFPEQKATAILKAVATDGRRLSLLTVSDLQISEPFQILIPLRAVRELTKILEKEGEVKVGVEQNRVFFQTHNFSFFSQLIDARFPDYQGVIPRDYRISFKAKREELMAAIRRVSLLTEQQTRLVKFTLKGDSLLINTTSARLGSAYQELSVLTEQKEEIEIGFNATFLLEALRIMEEDLVEVHLIDNESPGVFQPVESQNYLYILMPVKLRD